MVVKPTLFSNGMKFDKAGDAQRHFPEASKAGCQAIGRLRQGGIGAFG
jgi:hypothetical protein